MLNPFRVRRGWWGGYPGYGASRGLRVKGQEPEGILRYAQNDRVRLALGYGM
jgi:hypothetical protein